jgi:anti-sigma factor (TIGR02949 family)
MEKHSSCQQLLGALSEYIDGELSDALCADLERHLCECENCQIVLDTTLKTINLYKACNSEDCLPDDVRQRLFARLNLDDYIEKRDKVKNG